jgi:hypothetical protein
MPSAKVPPYEIEAEKREDGTSEEDIHILCTAEKKSKSSQ